jgi:hypothetical protein
MLATVRAAAPRIGLYSGSSVAEGCSFLGCSLGTGLAVAGVCPVLAGV